MGVDREIPKGWTEATLEELALINPKCGSDLGDELDISFLPMSAVGEETGEIDVKQTRKMEDVRRGYTPFIDGDVIFAKITPCMENGKVAVVSRLKNGIGFGSTEFFVVRPLENTINKYIFFFLVQRTYRKNARRNMTGTAGQLRVPKLFFCNTKILLPPLPEQHRIVAKIEELFSSLDKGIESLKTAQQQLKVYRQAVLKWAFEGRLTNKNVVDGEWPSGWKYLRLRDITTEKDGLRRGPFGSAIKKEFFVSSGYKIYEQGNAINDDPYRGNYFIDEKRYQELATFKVIPGDLIVSCSGVTLGRISEIPIDAKPGIINQALLRIRLRHNLTSNKYFVLYFRAAFFQKKIFAQCQGSAMPNLVGIKDFKEIELLIPPLSEQNCIVAEIESRLSVCDKIEESIEHSLKQAESLRQSILKKAFEGKLVPQDPNDLPASALLARIKAEREKNKSENPPLRQTRKARTKKAAA